MAMQISKQIIEHRSPVDPKKHALDIAALEFQKKKEKRKAGEFGLQTASFITRRGTGAPSFGILKYLLIIFAVIFLLVGPSAGVIFQLTQYLSPTILFWIGGIIALIMYIRR